VRVGGLEYDAGTAPTHRPGPDTRLPVMMQRLNQYLFDDDGKGRRTRLIGTWIALIVLAVAGSAMFTVMQYATPRDLSMFIWMMVIVVALKIPLIAFVGWLIYRNKEIPGVPVVWSDREVREILNYIVAQARASAGRPDAAARLVYLSREAWHVADQADGALKADAVGVALEIDRLAAQHGVRRTA
jgi:hypothetical protein